MIQVTFERANGGYVLSLAGSNRAIYVNAKYFRKLFPSAEPRSILGCDMVNVAKAKLLFGEIDVSKGVVVA